ncbi:succinate dehydrogenase assembly factor 4, mitochondrial [Stomoxys calcitrans]|uniref:Succinate dehydrogenase assembly factor 4, mitochondrial n=1 Tax=Stomoxys calcitrans TaxID=35570 RepID=A0A1I8Q5J7_STOCA|nr:succinate dehydrogenase assembly factor 4, mitochondrial [Stomoxys calcitrans]
MSQIVNVAKQTNRLMPQITKQVACFSTSSARLQEGDEFKGTLKPKSARFTEFQKKLRAKTPLGKLDEFSRHPFQEVEPLRPWPNNTNPHTGEIGGPAGPEPTRYGDWERKGRVSDF